jgi:putative hydrolase of the HAD superfamily
MTSQGAAPTIAPFDWSAIRLAAFDVDGTLYRQSTLRLHMAAAMLFHVARSGGWKHIKVIGKYRKLREQLGEAETDDFDAVLLERTAAATGTSTEDVRELVAEWMEARPLPHLVRCRYPGLQELFGGLRARGKRIGVLSDYPVEAKLGALGLAADHVAWAGDAEIGVLKPHPKGLQHLMDLAGVQPGETVLIGDRADRDGLAAQRAGAHALIRSDKPLPGWQTFRRFDDPLFAPVLAA